MRQAGMRQAGTRPIGCGGNHHHRHHNHHHEQQNQIRRSFELRCRPLPCQRDELTRSARRSRSRQRVARCVARAGERQRRAAGLRSCGRTSWVAPVESKAAPRRVARRVHTGTLPTRPQRRWATRRRRGATTQSPRSPIPCQSCVRARCVSAGCRRVPSRIGSAMRRCVAIAWRGRRRLTRPRMRAGRTRQRGSCAHRASTWCDVGACHDQRSLSLGST